MYSLLLNYNNRAKNYLKIFKEKKIYFNYVVICNSKKKIIKYPYSKKTLVFKNKKFDNKILNEINLRKIKKIIISPGDGEIIDKSFLKNKEILHCHPRNQARARAAPSAAQSAARPRAPSPTMARPRPRWPGRWRAPRRGRCAPAAAERPASPLPVFRLSCTY